MRERMRDRLRTATRAIAFGGSRDGDVAIAVGSEALLHEVQKALVGEAECESAKPRQPAAVALAEP